MMRHQIWLKSHTPNNNNQKTSPSQTEGRKEPSQPTNQCVQQPTKEIFRLILNNKKTKENSELETRILPKKVKNKNQQAKTEAQPTNTQYTRYNTNLLPSYIFSATLRLATV